MYTSGMSEAVALFSTNGLWRSVVYHIEKCPFDVS